jgi:predicted RecA/RadA family phage recombinase
MNSALRREVTRVFGTTSASAVQNPFSAVCTQPATPASDNPVLVGQIPGVVVTDERADGTTVVQTDGIFLLSVKGENNAGAVAVAIGDILYYEAGASRKINKDNVAGVRFGYALATITSGATVVIPHQDRLLEEGPRWTARAWSSVSRVRVTLGSRRGRRVSRAGSRRPTAALRRRGGCCGRIGLARPDGCRRRG